MDDRTKRFVEAALEKGWISRDQIDECLKIQETVREVGVEQRLEEILVRKGHLTAQQSQELSRELARQKIGKYQILEKLGEGGAGIVYKANQEPLQRKVAVKVLSKRRSGSDEYLERFQREARVAVTLNHQNIVRGLDYGEEEGFHYFVMEYVEGESLHSILAREGTIDERRALDYTLQTVEALRHAARYDLVHRDIKPENILITQEQVAKLCDLGLAKPSLVETAKASKDGTTIGTPTYMSPEQIRGKDETDFRADVYSLGITLYHMLAGRPPFTGASADIVVRKHLREDPVDPRELNPKISSSSAAIIMKMIAKRPAERYGSLDHLAEDLKAVLDGRPPVHTIQLGPKKTVGKVQIDLDEGAAPRRALRERQRRSPVLIVVLAALILGGVAAVLVLKPFGEKKPKKPGGDAADAAPKVQEPSDEELAEEDYRVAVDFLKENPDAAFETKREFFELVVKKFPDTRWAISAKDRIRALEEEQRAEEAAHLKAAQSEFEKREARAAELTRALRYGEAIAEMKGFPAGYEDTDYPGKAALAAERLSGEAAEKVKEIFADAETAMNLGRFDEARKGLEALKVVGIPKIEDEVVTRLEQVESARWAEEKARTAAAGIFRAVVGEAFCRAGKGEFREAENDLVKAGERAELSAYRRDLEDAWKDLREAARFQDAMKAAAEQLAGHAHRFKLVGGGREEAAGKVLGADDEGIRLARGAGEEQIPFSELAPVERNRLAFAVLDIDSGKDHAAALLYFLAHGLLEEAKAELEGARMLGEDPAPLRARIDLVVEHYGALAEEHIRKATLLRVQKRPADAAKQLRAAIDDAPWNAKAHRLLGEALVETGEHREAAAALTRALVLGDEDPAIHYFLGLAYEGDDRSEDALKAYSRYVALVGDDGEFAGPAKARMEEIRGVVLKDQIRDLERQARDAWRKKRWDDVIEAYAKLFDLKPSLEEALYYIGRAYVERGDVLEGFINLKRYLTLEPSGRRSSDARRQVKTLASAYAENLQSHELLDQAKDSVNLGNREAALKLLEDSLTAGPLNGDAYLLRGKVHLGMGEATRNDADFEAALEDFRVAEQLGVTDELIHEDRALALYYLDRLPEALAEVNQAVAAKPDRWSGHNLAGLIRLKQGEYEDALELFMKAAKLAPEMATVSVNRALAYEGLGRFQEADAECTVALEKNPSDADIATIDALRERLRKRAK